MILTAVVVDDQSSLLHHPVTGWVRPSGLPAGSCRRSRYPVAQRSATTPGQAEILAALDIAEPGRLLDFELPAPFA